MCGSAFQSVIYPVLAAGVVGIACWLLGYWHGRTEAWREAGKLTRRVS